MNEHVQGVFLALFGALFLGFMVGLTLGNKAATHRERSIAVEAKVGRWVVDAETGDRVFVYGRAGGR